MFKVFLREVIQMLQSEGYAASAAKVRHARVLGWLRPKPRTLPLGSGVYVYSKRHVQQLRQYLAAVRPGPRPQKPRPTPYVDPGLAERQRSADETLAWLEKQLVRPNMPDQLT